MMHLVVATLVALVAFIIPQVSWAAWAFWAFWTGLSLRNQAPESTGTDPTVRWVHPINHESNGLATAAPYNQPPLDRE